MKFRILFLYITAVSFFGCNKESSIEDITSQLTIYPKAPPILTTSAVSKISVTTAVCGGTITNNGGTNIVRQGVCYGYTVNPVIGYNSVFHDTISNNFNCTLTNLPAAKTIHVRAFAINANDTAYGNDISFTTLTPIQIGQFYAGGQVFYLDSSYLHGLVVAANPTTTTWGPLVDFQSYGTADGMANTNLIVSVFLKRAYDTTNVAVFAARHFSTKNTYHDWYIPAIHELELLYTNKNLLSTPFYDEVWSSTEYSTSSVYCLDFYTGLWPSVRKDQTNSTLLIRAF